MAVRKKFWKNPQPTFSVLQACCPTRPSVARRLLEMLSTCSCVPTLLWISFGCVLKTHLASNITAVTYLMLFSVPQQHHTTFSWSKRLLDWRGPAAQPGPKVAKWPLWCGGSSMALLSLWRLSSLWSDC